MTEKLTLDHQEQITDWSEKDPDQVFCFDFDKEQVKDFLEYYNLPELPQGYGFSGGSARAMVCDMVLDKETYIRDIDIVSIRELKPDNELDIKLPREHLLEDGEVKDESLGSYFRTRDFTINECLVAFDGGRARCLATGRCLADIQSNRIIPTEYEGNYYYEDLKYKLQMKGLMMELIFDSLYGESEFDHGLVDDDVPEFFMALMLNKIEQVGIYIQDSELVKDFVEELEKKYLVPEFSHCDIEELKSNLSQLCNFEFNVCYPRTVEESIEKQLEDKYENAYRVTNRDQKVDSRAFKY